MIKLLNESIFKYNLYCSDIKPSNYVYKINKSEKNESEKNEKNEINKSEKNEICVKMIDLGSEFCILYKNLSENDLFFGTNISLDDKKMIFYLVHLLQLYLFINKEKELFEDLKILKLYKDIIINFIYETNEIEFRQFLYYHENFTKQNMIEFIDNI